MTESGSRLLLPKCTMACAVLLAVYFGSKTGADVVIAQGVRSWMGTDADTTAAPKSQAKVGRLLWHESL